MRFAFPLQQLPLWLAGGLCLLLAVAAGLRWFERRHRSRLASFVDLALAPRVTAGTAKGLRRPLFWLPVAGTALALVALAQPHWGQSWHKTTTYSRDIIVCLDLSESMNATDIPPSRIDRAKYKVTALMDRASGDRFGLVAFSGAAVLLCPLTHDHAFFRAVLDAVDTSTVTVEGTNIEAALSEAAALFAEEDAAGTIDSARSRAILLVSDGEQAVGDAAAAAEEAGAKASIFSLGVGGQGGEVTRPVYLAGETEGGESPAQHHTRLDEGLLNRVAGLGAGAHIRVRPDNEDIALLMERLQALSARAMEDEVRFQMVNRYQWPLAGAFLCFAGEALWLTLLPFLARRHPVRGGEGGTA